MAKKILIVEDSEISANVLRFLLDSTDFEVVLAVADGDGRKAAQLAIEILTGQPIDLIILDSLKSSFSPDLPSLAVKLVADQLNIPVIVLTASPRSVRDLQAPIVLDKATSGETLLEWIEKLLG